jgi:hypothetical protein
VTIYSGGNDTVTLDVSTTINSLTLGGNANGATSELTDGGKPQTFTITNTFRVGQNGFVNLAGGSTMTASNLNNSGNFFTSGGGNTVNITGTLTNEYQFDLFGPGDTATIGNLVNPHGNVVAYNGSKLQINGNAYSQGDIFTSGSGGNTLKIAGTLTNTGYFILEGPGDEENQRRLGR